MAKTKISEFSTTAGNNTDINSINIAEGCAPSGINDAIRELMRQLKEFQTGGAGDSVNSGGDFSVATNKFTVASASGNTAVAGTLAVTGVATLTAQPILSSLTASKAVFTDSSKGLVSNDVTGTGNVVMSNSPTLVTPALGTPASGVVTNLTGTASININGTVGATTPSTGAFTTLSSTGNTTLGDADTDTLTFNASFVTGTTLKSAKLDTNTLSLAAYDVDGTAYTNLVTLTAGNTPTLALTSTGVGTINNMSIGATTASTGAFTTLSASGNVTLSGGTANGVAYLNGSKVVTTGSALTFDGTNLNLGASAASSVAGSVGTLTVGGTNANVSGGVAYQVNGTAKFYQYVDTGSVFKHQAQTGVVQAFFADGTEGMRLTSTGLGIGTSSPASKLDVVGRISATNSQAFLFNGSTGTYGTFQYNGTSIGDIGTGNQVISGGSTGDYALSSRAGNLLFGINGSERARIDTSGNLGLGVTPSDGAKVLAIGNGTAPTTNITGGILYVESGALKFRGSSGTVTTIANA